MSHILRLIKEKNGKKLPKDRWKFEVIPHKERDTDFKMDAFLKANLDKLKKTIRNDWDYVFVVDGQEGAGKSVLAQQLAFYVSDGDFDIDEICFSPEEFKEQVLKSEKYNAIVFDEAFRGLSSRASLTATNRILVSMLQEIRARNLFVFIVLPSIWDLDKYVALHRCTGLIHVHTTKDKHRGYFKFYNKDKIKFMFRNHHKLRYDHPQQCSFKGSFPNFYPLGKEEYQAKKAKSLGDYAYDKKEDENNYLSNCKESRANILNLLLKFMSQKEIADALGVNRVTIRVWTGKKRARSSINPEEEVNFDE